MQDPGYMTMIYDLIPQFQEKYVFS